jgi:diguanylate cyclase (GGDEF)-like protein
MNPKHEKISMYLFYTLIMIEIIIVAFMSFKRHENLSFSNEPLYLMDKDWSYMNESGSIQIIDLPIKLSAGKEKTVIISHQLPQLRHRSTLGILTTHQNITAYIDNEIIYSRINQSDNHLFNIPKGRTWDIIPLPTDAEGKNIILKFSSEYEEYAGIINDVQLGTKASILLHNIQTFGVSFVISILILISGFFLVIVYYFLKKLLIANKSILYLGWFSILASIWMIMESNLTQIFLSNAFTISALNYLSLMTFPIPLLFFIASIDNYHYKRVITSAIYFFIGNAFLLIFLQTFNIVDFHESLLFLHIELFIILSIIFSTLCLELYHYKNTRIKILTLSLGILFAFGFVELITFNFQTETISGEFFQIGFLIFDTLFFWSTLRKVVEVIKLSETAKFYKMLATRDPLTNCRSRVSYEKDLEHIDLERNIVIFLADVNYMKQVNDTYGHHAGDEVIILCSQCLLKAFGRRVYRIGGDEFVCIDYDLTKENIEAILNTFLLECKKANEDTPYTFEVSVGYAFYERSVDKNIYDTVKRADKDMYERKSQMKI